MKSLDEHRKATKEFPFEVLYQPPQSKYIALTPWECLIVLAISCAMSFGIGYLVRSIEVVLR